MSKTQRARNGFSVANLKNFRHFYSVFPDFEKGYTECSQLTWSYIRLIMRVENQTTRDYYINQTVEQQWSTRQLERNIKTLTY